LQLQAHDNSLSVDNVAFGLGMNMSVFQNFSHPQPQILFQYNMNE
jgi:hypothetical protein